MSNGKSVTKDTVLHRDSSYLSIRATNLGSRVECFMTQGGPRGVRWKCPVKDDYSGTVKYWIQQGFREVSLNENGRSDNI